MNRAWGLLDRSFSTLAELLGQPRRRPPVAHRPIPTRQPPQPAVSDALAGVCNSLALRDLTLVDALLGHLEAMEASEHDPDTLAQLYQLDHLATRLRRNAENLRVLAGASVTDPDAEACDLVDVIRAAMSSIEHYARITVGRVVSLGVVGTAADDVGRLLAELLDNAANHTPPTAPVRVSAHLTEQGSVLLRVEDHGVGLPPEKLRALNARLSTAPVMEGTVARHIGLAVVRRIANRHRIRVWLDRRTPHGTTTTVLLPAALVCDVPGEPWSGTQTVRFASGQPSRRPEGPAEPATAVASPPPAIPDPPAEPDTVGGLPRRIPRGGRESEPDRAESPAPGATDLAAFVDGQRQAGGERDTADTDDVETSRGNAS